MVMGRKAKAMEQQIQQLQKDIEAMRSAASEKELELKICKDELAGTKSALDSVRGELNAANKSLEDFRSRQAAIVSAMEEATKTKERILNEAKANAAKQEADGKARREQLISEGQSARDRARNEANATIKKANEEAEAKLEKATAEAEKAVNDAEKLASEMIEDAKLKAKGIVEDAEGSVLRLTAKSDELTLFLREKARIALEETRLYTEILDSVAECKELSDLPHECDFDCANCENKCDDYLPADEPEDENCADCQTPCGKQEPCCSKQEEKSGEQPEEQPEEKPEEKPEEQPEEKSEEKPEDKPEEQPEDQPEEGGNGGEAPLTTAAGETAEETPAEEENAETEKENAAETADEFPSDYTSAASLMRSIYSIEGRELPDESADDGEEYDVGEGTPLTADGDESFAMPVDPDFEDILGDLLGPAGNDDGGQN